VLLGLSFPFFESTTNRSSEERDTANGVVEGSLFILVKSREESNIGGLERELRFSESFVT
jgi:hypothetical protein